MRKITVLLSILVLALGILTAGCGGGDKGDKKAAAPAPAAKEELIVGTEPSFAPFEFPEKDSKEFTGFDMDLIRALAKEMGYKKCTIKNMGFDALIPAINAGNLDVSIAGFSITEERKKQVIFSQPYYKSGLAFVVRKDVNDVKKFEDLQGKTIAVQLGTTGALYGEKLKEKAGNGLYIALFLFVGIPVPGTGAWTGTLAASILDMDFKRSVKATMAGVVLAGVIMGAGTKIITLIASLF